MDITNEFIIDDYINQLWEPRSSTAKNYLRLILVRYLSVKEEIMIDYDFPPPRLFLDTIGAP